MSGTIEGGGTHPLRGEVRLLLQLATVVFVWTVGIVARSAGLATAAD